MANLRRGILSIKAVFRDSATICSFNSVAFEKAFGSVYKGVAEFANAIAGWDSNEEDMRTIARRNQLLERCYSLREGEYIPIRDDDLPERFFNETIYNKYGEPKSLDREEFLSMRRSRYLSDGLNEAGLPVVENIQNLELDFTIPTLRSMNMLG